MSTEAPPSSAQVSALESLAMAAASRPAPHPPVLAQAAEGVGERVQSESSEQTSDTVDQGDAAVASVAASGGGNPVQAAAHQFHAQTVHVAAAAGEEGASQAWRGGQSVGEAKAPAVAAHSLQQQQHHQQHQQQSWDAASAAQQQMFRPPAIQQQQYQQQPMGHQTPPQAYAGMQWQALQRPPFHAFAEQPLTAGGPAADSPARDSPASVGATDSPGDGDGKPRKKRGRKTNVYPCGKCGVEVQDGDDAVMCEYKCNKWFHARCSGLTPLGYEALSNSKDALWACGTCLPASTEDNPVPKPGRPPKAHRKRQKGSDGKSRSPDSHQGGQSEQMGSEIYSDTYSQSHDSPYTNAADDDDDGQDEDDNDDDDDDNDDNDDDGDNDDDDQDDDQDDGDDDDDDQQDSLHSSDAGQARAHGGQGQWAGHGSVEISNLTGAY